ncbi:hypothetical protein HYV88_01550 [Candidatus Woesearchaeota archaeon]|nr:hypothetical protein [Candidatus Woesearchaeota archaeon]
MTNTDNLKENLYLNFARPKSIYKKSTFFLNEEILELIERERTARQILENKKITPSQIVREKLFLSFWRKTDDSNKNY